MPLRCPFDGAYDEQFSKLRRSNQPQDVGADASVSTSFRGPACGTICQWVIASSHRWHSKLPIAMVFTSTAVVALTVTVTPH